MKEIYTSPELTVIDFENEIITSSANEDDSPVFGHGDDKGFII